MTRSRRSFLQLVGANGLAVAAGARLAALTPQVAGGVRPSASETSAAIRLSSNENGNGPGPRVLSAIQDGFAQVNRYPFQSAGRLQGALATALGVTPSQLVMGCGSSEILDVAVMAFTAPDRGLVTAMPTFELVNDLATHMGHPVEAVPVTDSLQLDLGQMAAKASGAGLVYVCNPNNPTGTLHGAKAIEEFVSAVLAKEPRATILIDEAYHEYVERADYKSAVPIALSNPRVIVSRTFSKIYGLAGMRVGYAIGQPDTLRQIGKLLDELRISCLSKVAAFTALGDPARVPDQRRLNHDARAFTTAVFREAGYPPIPSEANFLMVNVKRDIRQFQADCHARGVDIARPFPPLLTYARVTIGTMDEMQRAAPVFREALSRPPSSARLEAFPAFAPPALRRGEPREC
jgi:histidinol-phosphate aminotransferase